MDASFPSSMVAAAGSDALANVENVIGSDYDDTLMGNAADNVISGGKGVDTIHG